MSCSNCGEDILTDEAACPSCGALRSPARCDAHPDRSADAQCALCGTTVCNECDRTAGRTHLCPAHHQVPVVEGWAQVYSTSDDIEAQLIRENLESEGIEARVLSQKDHFTFTVDLGDLSPVRVLVPAYDYSGAEAVLRSHMDSQGEVSFACANCGEAYEPGSVTCASCGERIDSAAAPQA